MEEPSNIGNKKKIQIILIAILVGIGTCVIIGFTFLLETTEPTESTEQGSTGPVLTAFYSAISPEEAYELINTSLEVAIIDVRSACPCNYDTEHIGEEGKFKAIKNVQKEADQFYNVTIDLLIYDMDGGSDAINYCELLVNHTYGKICYIEGGFASWKNKNFSTIIVGQEL